jgi:hypothetical protein
MVFDVSSIEVSRLKRENIDPRTRHFPGSKRSNS